MTSRVMAIRGIATDTSPEHEPSRHPRHGGGALKIAAWLAAIGAGGFLMRRVIRRRRAIDLGTVSDDWVSRHRSAPDPYLG